MTRDFWEGPPHPLTKEGNDPGLAYKSYPRQVWTGERRKGESVIDVGMKDDPNLESPIPPESSPLELSAKTFRQSYKPADVSLL